jgi:hypothetical protein
MHRPSNVHRNSYVNDLMLSEELLHMYHRCEDWLLCPGTICHCEASQAD